jgi:glycosyltransferase involved in cell wall biosynthesis
MIRILNSLYARLWLAANRFSLSAYQRGLQQILQGYEGRPVFIFPPGLGWVIQLFQRPQQLALALSRQGVLVFYMQPVHPSSSRGFHQEAENLYLCKVPAETFRIIEQPFVHVMTWNALSARSFNNPRVIYDYVDDLEAFDGSRVRLEKDHRQMLGQACLVLATAEQLFLEVQVTRPDSLFVPNGVDYAHFSPAEQDPSYPIPADLAQILNQKKPVIGYHGALARWFDFQLFEQVARKRQDLNFVLIGPDIDGSLRDSGLLSIENIHWLGVKSYQELPAYISNFDAATIPFQLNEITHSTSPIKLYEYLAAGKPVVITPMQESERLNAALPAEGVDEFCRQLDRALQLKTEAPYVTRLKQVAKENTWDQRAVQILQALQNQPQVLLRN